MKPANFKRMAKLALDYAQCYIDGKDAPEGKQGAYELYTLAMFLNDPAMRVTIFRDDSGKADKEVV